MSKNKDKELKEDLEELNKVLDASNPIDVENVQPLIQWHDVDYIEAEYLPLPINNLSLKYLIRITKPVALVLDEKPIEVRYDSCEDSQEFFLKDAVLERWREMICKYPDTEEFKDVNQGIKKLREMKEVRLVEVELRRKE